MQYWDLLILIIFHRLFEIQIELGLLYLTCTLFWGTSLGGIHMGSSPSKPLTFRAHSP